MLNNIYIHYGESETPPATKINGVFTDIFQMQEITEAENSRGNLFAHYYISKLNGYGSVVYHHVGTKIL